MHKAFSFSVRRNFRFARSLGSLAGPQTLRVPVSVGGGVDFAFGDLRIDSKGTILEDGESH